MHSELTIIITDCFQRRVFEVTSVDSVNMLFDLFKSLVWLFLLRQCNFVNPIFYGVTQLLYVQNILTFLAKPLVIYSKCYAVEFSVYLMIRLSFANLM